MRTSVIHGTKNAKFTALASVIPTDTSRQKSMETITVSFSFQRGLNGLMEYIGPTGPN